MKTCPEGHEYEPGNGCPICRNERKKQRYAESAEFREKIRQYNRNRDPLVKAEYGRLWQSENREALNARKRQRKRERYHSDPDYRQRILDQNAKYRREKRESQKHENTSSS